MYHIADPKPVLVPSRNKEERLRWVTSQTKYPAKREALLGHFSIFNRQDGNLSYGVESGLNGLADGSWDPSYLNYYDNQDKNKIKTDVFEDMLTQANGRLREDATMQTRSATHGWVYSANRYAVMLDPLGSPAATMTSKRRPNQGQRAAMQAAW